MREKQTRKRIDTNFKKSFIWEVYNIGANFHYLRSKEKYIRQRG